MKYLAITLVIFGLSACSEESGFQGKGTKKDLREGGKTDETPDPSIDAKGEKDPAANQTNANQDTRIKQTGGIQIRNANLSPPTVLLEVDNQKSLNLTGNMVGNYGAAERTDIMRRVRWNSNGADSCKFNTAGFPETLNGEIDFLFQSSVSLTITCKNDDGEVSDTVNVSVHNPYILASNRVLGCRKGRAAGTGPLYIGAMVRTPASSDNLSCGIVSYDTRGAFDMVKNGETRSFIISATPSVRLQFLCPVTCPVTVSRDANGVLSFDRNQLTCTAGSTVQPILKSYGNIGGSSDHGIGSNHTCAHWKYVNLHSN